LLPVTWISILRYYHPGTSNNSRFDACFLSSLKAARDRLPQ
jgi:hypothetical protein